MEMEEVGQDRPFSILEDYDSEITIQSNKNKTWYDMSLNLNKKRRKTSNASIGEAENLFEKVT